MRRVYEYTPLVDAATLTSIRRRCLHLPNFTPARLDREFDTVTLSEIVKAGLGDGRGGDEDIVAGSNAIDINPAQNPPAWRDQSATEHFGTGNQARPTWAVTGHRPGATECTLNGRRASITIETGSAEDGRRLRFTAVSEKWELSSRNDRTVAQQVRTRPEHPARIAGRAATGAWRKRHRVLPAEASNHRRRTYWPLHQVKPGRELVPHFQYDRHERN